MTKTINVSAIMRGAALVLGICVCIVSILFIANFLNVPISDISIAALVFAVALGFFGILMASISHPFKFVNIHFGFINTLLGRGLFMIYVGLSCIPFPYDWDHHWFQSTVGVLTTILGICNLVFAIIGSTGNPKNHEEVMLGV